MNNNRRMIFLLMLAAAWGSAAGRKVAPDLATPAADQSVDVIVRYKVRLQARHHMAVEAKGGHLRRNLEVLNAAS